MRAALGYVTVLTLAFNSHGQSSEKKAPPSQPTAQDMALRQELLAMKNEDQRAREALLKVLGGKGIALEKTSSDPEVVKAIQTLAEVDKKCRTRMKVIVEKHGWPGKTKVAPDGASAAWLLVQHADADLAFQKECLKLMEAAPRGEVEGQHIAYLTDRILVAEKKKQRFGTQLDAHFKPLPLEDQDQVDQRRAEVGLPPLAEYLKQAEEAYRKMSDKPADKK